MDPNATTDGCSWIFMALNPGMKVEILESFGMFEVLQSGASCPGPGK